MRRLADHLGATHVIANRLEIKDSFATGRLLRPVVAGPEKARLVREHARIGGATPLWEWIGDGATVFSY